MKARGQTTKKVRTGCLGHVFREEGENEGCYNQDGYTRRCCHRDSIVDRAKCGRYSLDGGSEALPESFLSAGQGGNFISDPPSGAEFTLTNDGAASRAGSERDFRDCGGLLVAPSGLQKRPCPEIRIRRCARLLLSQTASRKAYSSVRAFLMTLLRTSSVYLRHSLTSATQENGMRSLVAPPGTVAATRLFA